MPPWVVVEVGGAAAQDGPQWSILLGNFCLDVDQVPPKAQAESPLSSSLMRSLNKSLSGSFLSRPPVPLAVWLRLLIFPVFMTPWPRDRLLSVAIEINFVNHEGVWGGDSLETKMMTSLSSPVVGPTG